MDTSLRRTICVVILASMAALCLQTLSADVCVYKPPKVRRVCGVILDKSGSPLRGVRVMVLKDGTAVQTTTTDEAGEFDFSGLQAGKYELDAALGGFQHDRYQVSLSKPTNSCKHALRIQMQVGGIHCESDGIRETERPLSHKR